MIPVNLIDYTYFAKQPIFLSLNQYSGVDILNNIIEKYQDIICNDILGTIEYNNFVADFTNGVPVTQKWLEFLNGTTYTVDGHNVIWNGLKHLLPHFIYYYYMYNNNTITTKLGDVEPKIINGVRKNDNKRICEVWNIGLLYYGVDYNYKFYNYKSNIYDGTVEKYKPTVYNFLYNKLTEFPDWKFTEYKILNHIGF